MENENDCPIATMRINLGMKTEPTSYFELLYSIKINFREIDKLVRVNN